MRRLVVTGARGRIGRALLRSGLPGFDVVGVSRRDGDGFVPYGGLPGLLGSGDVLLHAAWSVVPFTAERNPAAGRVVDLPFLDRTLAALPAGSASPLILFLSTGAVYGPSDGRPMTEDDPVAPVGRYAAGKAAGELAVRGSGRPHLILRVSNLYGLDSTPEDAQGVIPRLIRCALSGDAFEQWGANPVKDYLYFDDFREALRLLIESGAAGLTVNVASGRAVGLDVIAGLIADGMGRPIRTTKRPQPAWDATPNTLDIRRLHGLTGFAPRIPLADGLRRQIGLFAPARG